mgnify:CR=1 FL=1
MKYLDCFRFLAARRTDQLVITSAGNSGQAWWAATRDIDRTFYLDASMSLATLFACGLAAAQPGKHFWAFTRKANMLRLIKPYNNIHVNVSIDQTTPGVEGVQRGGWRMGSTVDELYAAAIRLGEGVRELGGDIDGVDEDQRRDNEESRQWHVGGWARQVVPGRAVRLADLAKPTQMSKLQDRE